MSKSFSILFKLAVTSLILYFLASRLDWRELGQSFRNTDLGWYVAACFMVLISTFFMGLRWLLLLRVQNISLSLRKTMDLTFIGMFFNTFLLGSTGGDLTKLYYLNQYVPNQKTKGIVSLLMDRGIGLLVLIGLALPILPFQASVLFKNEDTEKYAQILIWMFVAGIVGLALFFLFPIKRLPSRWRDYIRNHPQLQVMITLFESIREHGRSGKLTIQAIVLSIISQMFNVFSAWMLGRAMGLEISMSQCIIIVAIVFTLISLPISIGGHGIRELAFIKLFSVFGIISYTVATMPGKETAIAYSLLFFSFQLVVGMVGGPLYLFHSRSKPVSTHEP